jgi:hypothetical protein
MATPLCHAPGTSSDLDEPAEKLSRSSIFALDVPRKTSFFRRRYVCKLFVAKARDGHYA